jgi:hypothetical protein
LRPTPGGSVRRTSSAARSLRGRIHNSRKAAALQLKQALLLITGVQVPNKARAVPNLDGVVLAKLLGSIERIQVVFADLDIKADRLVMLAQQ